MYQKNAYCSYCGTQFAAEAAYPKRCARCGNTTYSNPLPVSVVLVPIGPGGLLLVKRVQEPAAGQWGLPGGFIEMGESWQEAGAREVREETGFAVNPAEIVLFDTRSAPDGTLLVFGLAPPLPPGILAEFVPSAETSAARAATGPEALAFSTHTETANRYWKESKSYDQADAGRQGCY